MSDATSPTNEPLDPLEAKVERDRAELVGTMEALRDRVETTADDYRHRYSVDGVREGATSYVMEQVRTRPLQTAAVAAGAAYPILRLVSKIPAPIMLLGAGVALAGRTGKPQPRASVDVQAVHAEVHAEGAYDADGNYRDPAVTATGGRDAASAGAAHRARASVSGAAASASDRVSAVASDVGDTAADLRDGAAQALTDAQLRAAAAGESLADAAQEGVDEVLRTIRQRPFVTAGVSLLVGGALAAMLPRSRVEDRLMGETADEARARARAAAEQAAESARRVAAAARDEAVDQDLTPAAAREKAAQVGRRAKKAAGDIVEDVAEEAGASRDTGKDLKGRTEAEADRAADAAKSAGKASSTGSSGTDGKG